MSLPPPELEQPGVVPPVTRLIVIDDDAISREVLAMLALESGFSVEAFDSGDSALAWLTAAPAGAQPRQAVLTDLQMPGLTGVALAGALRQVCPPATPLIVMSGSPAAPAVVSAYDAFLLKPFSIETLDATLAAIAGGDTALGEEGSATPLTDTADEEFFTHLSRATYSNLARSMPAANLSALFAMCLDDSARRLEQMRAAATAADHLAYTRSAHAIKGGCATVGFVQLAGLAAEMEQRGLGSTPGRVDDSSTPQHMMEHFRAASERLRDMLNSRGNEHR